MAKTMNGQSRLLRRGAVYYFRARVPEDLKAHYGKREIIESLRTKDKREAATRVRARSAALDTEFESIRRVRCTPPLERIADAEIERIAQRAAATRLHADEAGRIAGLSDAEFARHTEWLDELERHGRAALARGSFEGLHERAEDWLHGHGYNLSRD